MLIEDLQDMSPTFVKILDAFYKAKDDVEDFIDMPIMNLSNYAFRVNNGSIEVAPLNECKFVTNDDEEVPFEEVMKSDDVSMEEVREALKDFVSSPDNSLHINNANIKSKEDIDKLSDDDIRDVKDMMTGMKDLSKMDDFFIID
jgi:hypothetical protein